ncbi:hypothetical protein EYW49_13945 [Siculibacillus lacustris]|uniref:Glycolipid-binding domain-containing protein n=1 Tax=Siculibacillus lacustris TaxID=1549641 RepID=A0A4Q9VLR3_9HYPH|nr:putative glycolipid-binding domain-containing protein [Siculibacillus lacustris]TBW36437.1 hypothetical protein EYW49_13945 [Siculibacillus lacustris]
MTAPTRAYRWRTTIPAPEGVAETALEHVELKIAETGIGAEGVVIGGVGSAAHGLRWRITVDPDWTAVRSLHLTRLGGPTVALRHDGYGEWSDGEGRRRGEFAGLSDCLVEGSPFGLTALLKRLGAKANKTQTVEVVAVTVPGFELSRAAVTLQPIEAGRRLRLTRDGHTEEIELDADGVVIDWGGHTRRLALEPAA